MAGEIGISLGLRELDGAGGGASYVGPLDLVPGAALALSFRAMTDGSTANAVRIRRSSDDAEQDFALVDNAVDTAAVDTFVGAGTGNARTWHDQSGNTNHAVQATAARQPLWTSSLINSKPGLTFASASTSDYMRIGSGIALNASLLIFAVGKMLLGNTGSMLGANAGAGTDWVDFGVTNFPIAKLPYALMVDAAFNQRSATADVSQTATLAAFFLLDIQLNSTEQSVFLNGTELVSTKLSDTITPFSAQLYIGDADAESDTWDGNIVEVLVYNTAVSGANRTALRQNIATYYGITL